MMQNESEGHDQIEQLHEVSSTAVASSDQIQTVNDQKPETLDASEERIPSVAELETWNGAREERNPCTVVDVMSGVEGDGSTDGESSTREQICRICHLSSQNDILVHLGCACKEELGISHQRCAETWFICKGNRTCEICGKLAENIAGIEGRGTVRPARILGAEMNETMFAPDQTTPYPRDSSNGCFSTCCHSLIAFMFLSFFLMLLSRLHGL
ncbi:hypothetical protein Ancab_007731 [Ancistrocladus abbreviatus]